MITIKIATYCPALLYFVQVIDICYMFRGVQCHQPICKLFSEDSMFLHENASSSFLNFMPLPMVVRASFDDLLLVSPGSRCVRDYYICNPITKQWFQLPKMPIKLEIAGFALVCMLDDCSNKQQLGPQFKYKVVLFQSPFPDIGVDEDNVKICADIFCSKSGCWSRSFFYYPRPKEFKFKDYIGIVIYKGILHWLENEFISAGIIALDLFNGPPRCSVIDFPDDFGQNSCGQIHLGAVGGEVRLLHVFKMTAEEECYFVMKVWELKYDKDNSTSWVLIHEINLKRESGVNDTEEMVSMLAVHPNNGDVVFMIWGKHLFQYKITQDKYEKVDELQEPLHPFERVVSTPLVHLAWPTPVPSHPPSI